MDKEIAQEPQVAKSNTRVNGNHRGILVNIIVVNFFYRIFGESFRVLLIPFAYDEKGWTNYEYGLVLSIAGYVTMAVIFFLGLIVDIQFKRTTMIIALISTMTSAIVFTRVNLFVLSIVFYCLYAVGQQLMMISTNAFIANETKKGQHRTLGFTGNMVFRGLGSAFSPIICMYLLTIPVLNYNWVFTIMGSFGFVALVLVLVLRLVAEETPKEEIDYAQELSETSGDDFTDFEKEGKKSILGVQASFGVGRMLMGFTSGVAIPFVGAYIYNNFNNIFESNLMAWAWLNSINWIVLTLGYLFMGFVAERIGKDIIVVVFWTLVIPAAVGIMLAGNANRFYLTCFFFTLRSFFAMTPSAAWNSFMFEWIPPRHRGKTLGLVQTGQRGMRATGTLIGGLAFDALQATLFPIAMTAYPIAGLVPLIISKVVRRNIDKKSEKEEEPKEFAKPPEEEAFPSLPGTK